MTSPRRGDRVISNIGKSVHDPISLGKKKKKGKNLGRLSTSRPTNARNRLASLRKGITRRSNFAREGGGKEGKEQQVALFENEGASMQMEEQKHFRRSCAEEGAEEDSLEKSTTVVTLSQGGQITRELNRREIKNSYYEKK